MSGVTRLLAYVNDSVDALPLSGHLASYGPLPEMAPDQLIESVARSGLRGRGGAAFPVAAKLSAVRANRRSRVVVANGVEREPASAKDQLLMARAPHLVIDGVVLAARAVGADSAAICVAADESAAAASVERALAERSDGIDVRLFRMANDYLSGEESALVHQLNGGPAKPRFVPPRPFERGVGGRPTLIQNVETLAHIAQIARFGSAWFRECGTDEDPGTTLVTISGAVARPGVYEIECGTPLHEAVAIAGGETEEVQAFLIGGYFGSWFAARGALDLPLAHSRRAGGSLGSGVVVALPAGICGVEESARIVRYLAEQNARQCGPCTNGLAAIAEVVADIAAARAGATSLAWLEHWSRLVAGRGACHHPDGVVRFLRSSLAVFADEYEAHLRGRCEARGGTRILPVPAYSAIER